MTEIVPFSDTHLAGALRLSQQVSWPHRHEDWALIAALSSGVAALDGDTVVGTAFCTAFGDQAALNMIIVDAEMRGRGLGRKLMQAIIDIGQGRGLRLIATQSGLPLYRKFGFEEVREISQFQGVLAEHAITLGLSDKAGLREGGLQDLPGIIDMDHRANGMDRRDLLTQLADTSRILLCEGGYGMSRRFGRGQLVGPIVADTAPSARALLLAAMQGLEGQFVRVDTRPDLGLAPLLAEMGLQHAGGGIVMHAGPPLHHSSSEFVTYALASQALG